MLNPCRAEEYRGVFEAAGVGHGDPYMIQGRQEEIVNDIKLAIQVVGIHELHFVAIPGESARGLGKEGRHPEGAGKRDSLRRNTAS